MNENRLIPVSTPTLQKGHWATAWQETIPPATLCGSEAVTQVYVNQWYASNETPPLVAELPPCKRCAHKRSRLLAKGWRS